MCAREKIGFFNSLLDEVLGMGAAISAIDYYLPKTCLINADLAIRFPSLDEDSIFKQSGVRKRYVAGYDEAPSDMAVAAAKKLLDSGCVSYSDIDGLIFCSHIPDQRSPLTSVLIHQRLDLSQECLCLDVPGGCTGFVNALMLAKSLIESEGLCHVLLLTADAVSWTIPNQAADLSAIFGDGAAATLVSRSSAQGIGKFCYGVEPEGASSLYVKGGGARNPAFGLPFGELRMNGYDVLRFALRFVPPLVQKVLKKNGLTKESIELYVFHQASGFVLSALQRKCQIEDHQFMMALEDVGNTVSSSIPIALAKGVDQGRLLSGMKIMLVGFGVGFSWAGVVIDWWSPVEEGQ